MHVTESFCCFRFLGDIVEKIRGFVMQLGWKKELEMLIEECENNYKVRELQNDHQMILYGNWL